MQPRLLTMTGRVDWEPHAETLAARVTDAVSRWRPLVASTPRHVFVPRWWRWLGPEGWTLREGTADGQRWMRAAYSDLTLVTQLGPRHADHAQPGDHPSGRPASSSTQPGLAVQMYRHASLTDGMDVLDVGTGSGYGCALLARRLTDQHVTSVDVDDYLVNAAAGRLASIGLHPDVRVCDATGPLPGSYDRIVSMTSVAPIPASWLAGLRPGGRLVTVLGGTGLIVTAGKTPDGGAAGRTEWDRAGFMAARSGPHYPPRLFEEFPALRDADGERVSTGRYPVVHMSSAWELYSMLGVTLPGVRDHYEESSDGQRTAWLLHPDGSWARATGTADDPPAVHQSGPRQLWDTVDAIRHTWLRDGNLPAYGASVTITPDGAIQLTRGQWHASIPAAG
jgi:protein-L-isoaspartate O-methyltransferase